MADADKGLHPLHFASDLADCIQVKSKQIPDQFWMKQPTFKESGVRGGAIELSEYSSFYCTSAH